MVRGDVLLRRGDVDVERDIEVAPGLFEQVVFMATMRAVRRRDRVAEGAPLLREYVR